MYTCEHLTGHCNPAELFELVSNCPIEHYCLQHSAGQFPLDMMSDSEIVVAPRCREHIQVLRKPFERNEVVPPVPMNP